MNPTVIISQQQGPHPSAADLERAVADACAAAGLDVVLAPDLYCIPEDDPLWDSLRAIAGPVAAFLWLHPRPAEWLLRHHGVGADGLLTFDLATFASADAAVGQVTRPVRVGQASRLSGDRDPAAPVMLSAAKHLPRDGETLRFAQGDTPGHVTELASSSAPRWYPVIDEDRCTSCGHCLQFCLFGVYAPDADGRPRVTNPDKCKAGCPACARVCPSSAIMFPRYGEDEGIAGAPGKFVVLDAEAARMFRERVGKPHAAAAALQDGPDDAGILSEIDALIDDLDRQREGRQQ